MKKIFFYILMCLGIFIVFFTVGEICFRIFRGPPNPLAMTIQRYDEYLFEPNSLQPQVSSQEGEYNAMAHVNSLGYRGAEFSREKEPGKIRIFAVGDSFTFGVGAEDNETIPYLLESQLKGQKKSVEVINAGVGHTSPITHYVNLRDIHLQYHPDMVLLLLDLTDLQDDWHSGRHAVYDKNGEITGFNLTMIDGRRSWWLLSTYYSAFCKYFHNRLVRMIWKINDMGLKEYARAVKEGKKAKALIANSHDLKSDKVIMEYDLLVFARGRDRKDVIDKHFRRTAKYLLKIKDMLDQRHIPMVLVMYPYGIQVGGEQWGKGRVHWGFEEGKTYDNTYAFEIVEQFARENKIPFINTFQDFRRADPNKKYFFDYDGHLTPEGNKIVADVITSNPAFQKALNSL